MNSSELQSYDIFIIGGGINGAGIARDGAGRGYSVALAEMNDFASGTSSASTKLFHGGLRYLEFFKFKLVREALIEREVLLKASPHISWPMRFVLPLNPEMRFERDTPTSRFLERLMPWMKGRRPTWLIRLGLFLYDFLGRRNILIGTAAVDLKKNQVGAPLQDKYSKAYEYSDCWVEDSRLTLLNIIDSQQRGAKIYARTKVMSAVQQRGLWKIELKDEKENTFYCRAKLLINAGGPWVEDVIQNVSQLQSKEKVRLVRGSHIVIRKLYEHEKCYFFQGKDGRILFVIPYEEDFTLIGTTDAEHNSLSIKPKCSDAEIDYIIAFANIYFKNNISRDDIIWTYSGIRPLYDDGTISVSAATRDYVVKLNSSAGAPVLNIFGGKITTYRKLAESVLEEIDQIMCNTTDPWTADAPLPGGEISIEGVIKLRQDLAVQLPFLDEFTIRRLIRQYGTQCASIFSNINSVEDLSDYFGHGLFAHEIDWAIANEWVRSAEDFLWRRSKLGLRLNQSQVDSLENYIKSFLVNM